MDESLSVQMVREKNRNLLRIEKMLPLWQQNGEENEKI